jgi:hypothetical protein
MIPEGTKTVPVSLDALPVAIVGGGPVGLAAAAHLLRRNLPVKLYEAGSSVGANLLAWGHVRLFTPWRHCVDDAAIALLAAGGWTSPPAELYPTGGELVRDYLAPLAASPELAGALETGARVTAITRRGIDKVASRGREARPFLLEVETAEGMRRDLARAVIDVSGTWATPNPLGAGGLPADGEAALSGRIAYGIPDVLGRDRGLYAGRATLVVGAGHSAANVLLDLARLAEGEPGTAALWATRGPGPVRVYGGGAADQLEARGALGSQMRALVDSGRVPLVTGFSIVAIRARDGRIMVEGETADGPLSLGPFDRIVAATGQRPDLTMTRELRLDLDPWLESTRALGPLIDPNEHSCGSVPPHGHRELAHAEPGFYTAGVKSYGRAPTFLLMTGYEQVRSIAAALAGDRAAADDVRLVLPETGLCNIGRPAGQMTAGDEPSGCCGGPVPEPAQACCIADAVALDEGGKGCGCRDAA